MVETSPDRPLPLYLIVIMSSAVALLAGAALHALWPGWRWHHEPLHAAIEAVGGLVAIAMAVVLRQTPEEASAAKYRALASGFLGMGILDEFHAVSQPGDGFVLFRNMAGLAGGLGFLLVWRSRPSGDPYQRRWHPWVLAIGALSIGSWFLVFPQHVPAMVRNGEFTVTAIAPQSVACMCYFLAAGRLLFDYRRSGRSDDVLFAGVSLLFGLAEFMFMYSIPWDNRWWFWHALRLLASLLALSYMSRRYGLMTTDLQMSLAQTLRARETLSRSEGQLRQMLGERERMAQDLHDSTIQSLFAIGLNLERCQRLVSLGPQDVGMQLGTAVARLKAVIRDLRGYIVGVQPPFSNGRAFEATLTSLVHDMNQSLGLHIHLHVDPLAADKLTAEQAAHVLPIAREAMSNSLRHSAAKSVILSLHVQEGFVRLSVEDDGVGFDAAVESLGHGLKNMAARISGLGGRLEVKAEPGRGTCIICDLPLEQDRAAI